MKFLREEVVIGNQLWISKKKYKMWSVNNMLSWCHIHYVIIYFIYPVETHSV